MTAIWDEGHDEHFASLNAAGSVFWRCATNEMLTTLMSLKPALMPQWYVSG
jgi:hypothetical protein